MRRTFMSYSRVGGAARLRQPGWEEVMEARIELSDCN